MIRKALPEDWDQILELSQKHGILQPGSELLGDLFLVDIQEGQVTGFVWAGIVASGKRAYADYLTVSPKHKGTGFRLCKALAHELNARGVSELRCQVRLENNPEAYESYGLMDFLGMEILNSPFSLFVGDIKEGSTRWVRHQSRPN